MNEQEQGRIDRDAGDGGDRGGDSGLVQPPESNTYRGPYGEPIVVPVTDDPAGHPEQQPGHSDDSDRCEAFLDHFNRYARNVFAIGADDGSETFVATNKHDGLSYKFTLTIQNGLAHIHTCSLVSDPGSGRSDHGPSARRDG